MTRDPECSKNLLSSQDGLRVESAPSTAKKTIVSFDYQPSSIIAINYQPSFAIWFISFINYHPAISSKSFAASFDHLAQQVSLSRSHPPPRITVQCRPRWASSGHLFSPWGDPAVKGDKLPWELLETNRETHPAVSADWWWSVSYYPSGRNEGNLSQSLPWVHPQ